MVPDIRDLSKLHRKKECRYCKKPNATVRCRHSNCSRYFHVKCGVRNKCLFQFDSDFKSYCDRHVKINEKHPIHEENSECQICNEKMGAYQRMISYHPITSIPSCRNRATITSCVCKNMPLRRDILLNVYLVVTMLMVTESS